MAEKKVKPRAAKDIKPSDARQTILEGRKKVGPAKDVKPGSAREKAAKGKTAKKPASGGLTSERRFSDVKKSRGPFGQLTVRKDNLPAVKAEPGKSVAKYEEPKRSIVKAKPRNLARYEAQGRGVAKIGGPKVSASGAARSILSRGALTAGLILDPSTFDYKGGGKAGEGSDKPSGPLMKGGELPGYTYLPDKKRDGGGPEKRQGSGSPSMASPKVDREVPKKAAEFRKKNLDANKKAGKKPDKAPDVKREAPKASAPKKPGFKGNWVGAAPTEMQKRGGAKIKRKSFADLFKKD